MKSFYKGLLVLALSFTLSPSQGQSPVITMTTTKYYSFGFELMAHAASTPVQVDWGDGILEDFTVATTWTTIDPGRYLSNPATVKIYGTGIKGVWSEHNGLTALDIAGAAELQYLMCTGNDLDSLDVTVNSSLIYLSCGGNNLTSLQLNPGLQELFCHGNELSSLDLSGNSALMSINCSMNPLERLDLSGNPNLKNLWCWENQLAELDLSANLALQRISCYSNLLTSLDLSGHSGILTLDCHNNQLTSLKVRGFWLHELYCNGNQLDSLDLSDVGDLEILHCHENQLKTLTVSPHTNLQELFCYNNEITELDLSANVNLQKLFCNNNQLSELDLSGNPNLTELNCSVNNLDLATLPAIRSAFANYVYEPQLNTTALPAGDKIDLSSQLTALDINGVSQQTVYGWRTLEGKLLTNGIDYTQLNGVFTFLKMPSDPINCDMINPAFPDLKLKSLAIHPMAFVFDRKLTIPSGITVTRDGTPLADADTVHTGEQLIITAAVPAGHSIRSLKVNGVEIPNGDSYLVMDKDVVVTVDFVKYCILTFPEPVTVSKEGIPLNSSDTVYLGDQLEINLDAGNSFVEYFKVNGVNIVSGETYVVGIEDVSVVASLLQPSMMMTVSEPGILVYYLKAQADNTIIKIDTGTNVLVADTIGTSYKWIRYDLTDPVSHIKFFGPGITGLKVEYRAVTALDVSSNPDLQELICPENQISVLNLSGNPALKTLRCAYNQLTHLNISSCPALETLDCSSNQLTSLDVSQNVLLTTLMCMRNQLSSLDVSALGMLETLDCSSNRIAALHGLANTALKSLYCNANQLSSLDVSSLASLTELWCSENQLSNLDVSSLDKLYSLECAGNQIQVLDISANTLLTEFNCSGNPLTSFDITANLALEYLGCAQLQLTSLDVRQHVFLQALDCSYNPLGSIDVSANPNLFYLKCDNNQLTSLDLSSNAALMYLSCADNQLTSLDLSGKADLNYLIASRNQIADLDLSGVIDFYELRIDDNLLKDVNLSSLTYLDRLSCERNLFDLFSLPQIRVSPYGGEFTYAPQAPLPVNVDGTVIDLSRQSAINDPDGISRMTQYSWKTKDGTGLIEGSDYTQSNGVFTFLKAPADSFYCEMRNEAIPELVLTTDTIPVSSLIFDRIVSIPEYATVTCNETILNNGDMIKTHEQLTIKAIAPTGFTLARLQVNGADFSNGDIYTVGDQDIEIEVFFKENYSLAIPTHVSVSRGGVLLDETDTVYSGEELAIDAITPAGYTFVELTVNDQPFISGDIYSVASENVSIEVVFDTIDYALTIPEYITVTRNGSPLDASNPVHIQDQLTISANPPAGSGIISLTVNGEDFTSGQIFIVENTDVDISFEYLFPITMTTQKTGAIDLVIGAIEENTPIRIDWGDGVLGEYTAGSSINFFSNYLDAPATIKIYGQGIATLWAYDIDLTSLDVSANPELKTLKCSFNRLTTLDLSANVSLEYLECSYNELAELDLSANTNLGDLLCSHNRITALDLNPAQRLENLYAGYNQLTTLNLGSNRKLNRLDCEGNQLTALDVSANLLLSSLNCEYNQLTELNISSNNRLRNLFCGYNQLTQIDVSGIELQMLACASNQLQTLDLTSLSYLDLLDCSGNQLTALDLSGNPRLMDLTCSNNRLTSILTNDNARLDRIKCQNNAFDFSDLSKLRSINRFEYSPQSLVTASPNGAVVDLSVNYQVKDRYQTDQATGFTWKTVDGTALVEGTDFTADGGVFTFLKIPSTDVFCQMTNPSFPGLILRTEEIPASDFIFDCILSMPENIVVTCNGVKLNQGATVRTYELLEITAAPPAGYSLASISVNDAPFTSGQTFTVSDRHITIAAEFTAIDYTLTIPEYVTVTRDGVPLTSSSVVHIGDQLVIAAALPVDYLFEALSVNGISFISGQTYMVTDANVAITIQFTIPTPVANLLTTEIKVYPNPFANKLYVEIGKGRIFTMAFIDLSGNVILETEYNAAGADVSHLKSGAYIVKIVTSEGIVIRKLLKI